MMSECELYRQDKCPVKQLRAHIAELEGAIKDALGLTKARFPALAIVCLDKALTDKPCELCGGSGLIKTPVDVSNIPDIDQYGWFIAMLEAQAKADQLKIEHYHKAMSQLDGAYKKLKREKAEPCELYGGSGEKISFAAVIYNNCIYTGKHHSECIQKVVAHYDGHPDVKVTGKMQGFLTNQKRYVDRYEAMKIGFASGQITEEKFRGDMAFSENFWCEEVWYGKHDYIPEIGYVLREPCPNGCKQKGVSDECK